MKLEQISIKTYVYKKYALESMFDSIAKAGYVNYDFYAAAPHFCHYEDIPMSRERIDSVTAFIHNSSVNNNLKMTCFSPEVVDYPINIASENDRVRKKSVRYFLDYLDDLADHGCETLMLTSGWGYFDKDKWSAWERSKRSLKKIVSRAEELGITILLRPDSRLVCNLVNDLPSLVRMLFEIPSDSLKACIDVESLDENKESISDYFEIIPDRIGYFRFYNETGAGNLANGDMLARQKIRSYFRELDAYGYTGIAAIKLDFDHLVDPGHYAALAMKELKKII